ncbi:MAG: DUF2336 domain-containing protein [Pseudomonadota bacterium]
MDALAELDDNFALVDENKVERVVLAKRVGRFLAEHGDETSHASLEKVMRKLCRDEVDAVRGALSFELRRCERLPEDVIEAIAFDDPDVAAPFLQTSPAVDDAILMKVVKRGSNHAQLAIARRERLSSGVAMVLASRGDERVATSLARNRGVDFNEDLANQLIARFADSTAVMGELAARPDMPAAVAKKIKALTSMAETDERKGSGQAFSMLVARVRAMRRAGALSEQRMLGLVELEGRTGLEAILAALLDLPRGDVAALLDGEPNEALKRAGVSETSQARIAKLIRG